MMLYLKLIKLEKILQINIVNFSYERRNDVRQFQLFDLFISSAHSFADDRQLSIIIES